MIHCFDDDHGLHNVVSSCSEVMQLSYQLVAKTEQYLKHFSATAASSDGTIVTFSIFDIRSCTRTHHYIITRCSSFLGYY